MFGFKNRRTLPFGDIQIDDDKDIQVHKPYEAVRGNLWAEGRLLMRDLIFALMLAALVVVFVVQPVKVEGTSMLPRLHDGERIFVNKLVYYDEYRWAPKIDRGDIVVFWYPEDPSKSYIKRVIGLPGDTVEVHDGVVRVNGRDLQETYLDPHLLRPEPTGGLSDPLLLRHGRQPHNSSDSDSGVCSQKYVYGKVRCGTGLEHASVIHHENVSPLPCRHP